MATVILGGGIIGLASAYYLSLERLPSEGNNPPIHIVDSSHSLLLSASGFAGGFVAEDWFSPASASLGALSFHLHRKLAEQHNGQERWGYTGSHVYSLSISGTRVSKLGSKASNDDWLISGTSRAGVATAIPAEPLNADGSPAYFTPQPGGTLSTMGTPDNCAQVHPQALCTFLLAECQSRGVQLHLSATPTAITTDPSTSKLTGLTYTSHSSSSTRDPASTTLPCTSLILAAGAWTPTLFHTLFPTSRTTIPISPLAGYSLLAHSLRYPVPALLSPSSSPSSASPRHKSHALYASPSLSPTTLGSSYALEAFARLAPNASPEIWIGGLNDAAMPLPDRAEDVEGLVDAGMVRELRGGLVSLCGRRGGEGVNGDEYGNEDDFTDVVEGLCFRPVSETGVPIVGRVGEGLLSGEVKMGDGQGQRRGQGGGGVFIASGHGPWGISLSLGTGKVVSELVLGREVSADIEALGLR